MSSSTLSCAQPPACHTSLATQSRHEEGVMGAARGSKHACPLSLPPDTTHKPWPLGTLNLCRSSSLHCSPATCTTWGAASKLGSLLGTTCYRATGNNKSMLPVLFNIPDILTCPNSPGCHISRPGGHFCMESARPSASGQETLLLSPARTWATIA